MTPKFQFSISLFYCYKVGQDAFRLTPRIIGGEKARIEQFKWQAVVVYDSKLLCGGSIISPVKIVTAAHCVYRITDIEPLKVRVGSIDWNKGGTLVKVERVSRHRDYNKPTSLNNDVAVLLLSDALTFGPTIGAVVLAGKSIQLPAGTMVSISGYGSTSPGTNNPVVLHHVSVPIVSQKDCKKAYKKYPGIAKLTDNMICAGYYGVGGKDSCRGDSGGLYSNNFIWENECKNCSLFHIFNFSICIPKVQWFTIATHPARFCTE